MRQGGTTHEAKISINPGWLGRSGVGIGAVWPVGRVDHRSRERGWGAGMVCVRMNEVPFAGQTAIAGRDAGYFTLYRSAAPIATHCGAKGQNERPQGFDDLPYAGKERPRGFDDLPYAGK